MDVMTTLREMRSPTTGPTESAMAAGRAALAQKYAIQSRRPSGRRLLLVAASFAAAIVVVIAGAVGLAPGRGSSAQAVDLLRAAALASIKTSDPVVPPGDFLRVQSEKVAPTYAYPSNVDSSSIENAIVYLSPSHGDLYVPADRSQTWTWVQSSSAPVAFFGPGGKALALEYWSEGGAEAEKGETLRAANGTFYGGSIYPEDMSKMPTDPQALYRYIDQTYAGGSNSRGENMWVRISDLLRTGLVPSDLRAAMYETLAMMPNVSLTADQANLEGHVGVAIGREEPGRGYRSDIIIDPVTGQFIGEREVTTVEHNGVPIGTVLKSTAIATTVVDTEP